ncbi:ribonuclease Z [Plebeiibacterium marinum]|uniref:Ribonuclease Z n=1 Tax=Plebeiibacterium marinum TaxID=2992111 RepID=A0AAE3MES9_9BACT|nr:ribonuclease Z [Plebeiobacterium marinum]MCW3806256.1 ribonuclease Z [Plebeiobacterium marinum]
MSKSFSVTILGSNSALPTSERYPTAQVLNVSERFFLIDCGEGTQVQLRRNRIRFSKINHIFISHLHGDHCFGLIGLISTLGLLGRKNDLYIYAHPDLEKIMLPQLQYFCKELPYRVVFKSFDHANSELIYSDKHLEIYTIPLVHRIPTVGFLFKEKAGEKKIKKEFVFKYQPSIKEILSIKRGEDYYTKEGELIANNDITLDPPKVMSYAFCTDTRPSKKIIDLIKGVDLLYHEATFLNEDKKLAHKTYHSTAQQAAGIAKKAEVGKLLIGHYSTRYRDLSLFLDEAKSIFTNTQLSKEGDVITIS